MTPGRRAELRKDIRAETAAAIRHCRLQTPESRALYVKARRKVLSFIDTIKEV